MTKNPEQYTRDEQLLIDFLLGRCDREQAEEVANRLGNDPEFLDLHDRIDRTFTVLNKMPEQAAPADLTDRTMAAIDAARGRTAELARTELAGGSRSTFSIRELAGIAAAIILIVAVIVPIMQQSQDRALRSDCNARVGQMGSGLSSYAAANSGFLPGADPVRRRWLSRGDEPSASTSAPLFRLVKDGHVPATVFICPAVRGRPALFRVTASTADFPSAMHITYSYQHTLGGRRLSIKDPALAAVSENMAILSDASPAFAENTFRSDLARKSSPNHGGDGQNVLYLQGNVAWRPTPAAGVSGDNIFLADGVEDYDGDEAPTKETDSFLLPTYSNPGR
jgi:anti-sigma factor RsiW